VRGTAAFENKTFDKIPSSTDAVYPEVVSATLCDAKGQTDEA